MQERLPAIALTAYASPKDLERSITVGFHVHLAKPEELRRLISTVAHVLKGTA